MRKRTRREKNAEYMNLQRLISAEQAKELALKEQLLALKRILYGLISEYGEKEGKKIFSLMLNDSSQYWTLLEETFESEESIGNLKV